MNLGPDAPIVANANGGKQSETNCRLDLVDAKAMLVLGQTLDYGAKRYAPDNWRLISAKEHLNHLLIHAYAWLAGDTQDDHAGHLFTRAMMFLATAIAEKEKKSA